MKKLLLPALLVSLICLQTRAQNKKIIIDYSNPPKIEAQKIDIAKDLIIRFTNCKSAITPPSQIEIKSGEADQHSIPVQCEKDIPVELPKIFAAAGTKQPLTVTINADKTKNGDNALSVSFYIKPNGDVTQATVDTNNPGGTEADLQQLPDDTVNFVNPSFLNPAYINPENNLAPLITYNACNNKYVVWESKRNGKQDTNHLIYYSRPSKNKGVVFLVKNINTLKYDITVSNTFDITAAGEPDLFKTVFNMLAPTAKLSSKADNELQTALSRLIKLNKDLKAYLDQKMNDDCSSAANFEAEKKATVENIKKVYQIPDVFSFDNTYNTAKDNIITDKKKTNPSYAAADFNKEVQKLYNLAVTPDSIVTETKKLLRLLINTQFEYRYNVPQLQNADAITFTLKIKPKDGINALTHVTDQTISIPIKWGWKVDFTTGVYYSSIKNEQYALQDIVQSDSVVGKNIIKENNNNFGKSAVGVSALMHVFPRMGSIQPAFSFGVGTSLDLNYSLLAGAGIIFGSKNRFALSGGVNYSSVKKISEKYIDNKGQFIRQLSSVTSLDTYNKVKTGFFLSVTYSLGLTNKTQKAAAADNSNSN